MERGVVRFRNMKGEFLSENLDWSNVTKEQLCRVERHGKFQAFRTLAGEYLSLKDDGSLMVLPEEEIIEKGKLLDTFSTWGPFFKISFDLLIKSLGPAQWSSVLAFKGNDASKSCCDHGDRVPLIAVHSAGHLFFSNSVNGDGNYYFQIDNIVQLNKWHKIEIEQKQFDWKVKLNITNK